MHFIGRFESRTIVKQFGHEFQIINVTSEDEGQYQCSISNGQSILNRVFNLTVEGTGVFLSFLLVVDIFICLINIPIPANPRWESESMVSLVLDEESPAEVICDVTGLPKPEIKWFINGRLLRGHVHLCSALLTE